MNDIFKKFFQILECRLDWDYYNFRVLLGSSYGSERLQVLYFCILFKEES